MIYFNWDNYDRNDNKRNLNNEDDCLNKLHGRGQDTVPESLVYDQRFDTKYTCEVYG